MSSPFKKNNLQWQIKSISSLKNSEEFWLLSLRETILNAQEKSISPLKNFIKKDQSFWFFGSVSLIFDFCFLCLEYIPRILGNQILIQRILPSRKNEESCHLNPFFLNCVVKSHSKESLQIWKMTSHVIVFIIANCLLDPERSKNYIK